MGRGFFTSFTGGYFPPRNKRSEMGPYQWLYKWGNWGEIILQVRGSHPTYNWFFGPTLSRFFFKELPPKLPASLPRSVDSF